MPLTLSSTEQCFSSRYQNSSTAGSESGQAVSCSATKFQAGRSERESVLFPVDSILHPVCKTRQVGHKKSVLSRESTNRAVKTVQSFEDPLLCTTTLGRVKGERNRRYDRDQSGRRTVNQTNGHLDGEPNHAVVGNTIRSPCPTVRKRG